MSFVNTVPQTAAKTLHPTAAFWNLLREDRSAARGSTPSSKLPQSYLWSGLYPVFINMQVDFHTPFWINNIRNANESHARPKLPVRTSAAKFFRQEQVFISGQASFKELSPSHVRSTPKYPLVNKPCPLRPTGKLEYLRMNARAPGREGSQRKHAEPSAREPCGGQMRTLNPPRGVPPFSGHGAAWGLEDS